MYQHGLAKTHLWILCTINHDMNCRNCWFLQILMVCLWCNMMKMAGLLVAWYYFKPNLLVH